VWKAYRILPPKRRIVSPAKRAQLTKRQLLLIARALAEPRCYRIIKELVKHPGPMVCVDLQAQHAIIAQSPHHDTTHGKNVRTVLDLLDNGPHMNTWPEGAMTPFRSEKECPLLRP
jgi:hypothetical protein